MVLFIDQCFWFIVLLLMINSTGHKSSRKKDRSSRPKAKTRFKKERRGSNDKLLFIPESEKESNSGEDDS